MNKQRTIQALILFCCVLQFFFPDLFTTAEDVQTAFVFTALASIASGIASAASTVGGAAAATGSFIAANAPTIAAGASALGGAYSGYKQYEAQESQAEYREEMSEYNAEVQEQKARREEQTSIRQQLELRRQGEATIGKQRSLLAKSGVSMTQGSPLETLAETSADIEHEVEVASFEGKMRSRARESQAEQSEARATFAGERADTAGTMKYVGAARSGLSSGLSAAGGVQGAKSLIKGG